MVKGPEVLGECLVQAICGAQREVILVAPFITLEAFRRLFEVVPEGVYLRCVTRWLPQDIAVGVTDIDIWPMIRDRSASDLLLLNRLHAKYFRVDQECFVGSANITQAALGWTTNPNVELLVRVHAKELGDFENELIKAAFPATEELYQDLTRHIKVIREDAQTMRSFEPHGTEDVFDSCWLPSLRDPSLLYDAYIGEWDNLTSAARLSAGVDLVQLSLPKGLNKAQFRSYVAVVLLQTSIVRHIDGFVSVPRRFGEVCSYLKTLECANSPQFDATRAWQTLMRWLLYFLPERYMCKVFRYSEVFQKKENRLGKDYF